MKIEILPNEFLELADALGRNGKQVKGWVSHPVSTENPPSVLTTATTDAIDDDTSEPDWMNAGWPESERRAKSIGSYIIRNLLDFEGWLDAVLEDDKDIERIRFHYEPYCDDEMLSLFATVEFKNADRRKTPREVVHISNSVIPKDDEKLEDYKAEIVEYCILWGCSYQGLSHDDYLKWLDSSDDSETFKDE